MYPRFDTMAKLHLISPYQLNNDVLQCDLMGFMVRNIFFDCSQPEIQWLPWSAWCSSKFARYSNYCTCTWVLIPWLNHNCDYPSNKYMPSLRTIRWASWFEIFFDCSQPVIQWLPCSAWCSSKFLRYSNYCTCTRVLIPWLQHNRNHPSSKYMLSPGTIRWVSWFEIIFLTVHNQRYSDYRVAHDVVANSRVIRSYIYVRFFVEIIPILRPIFSSLLHGQFMHPPWRRPYLSN